MQSSISSTSCQPGHNLPSGQKLCCIMVRGRCAIGITRIDFLYIRWLWDVSKSVMLVLNPLHHMYKTVTVRLLSSSFSSCFCLFFPCHCCLFPLIYSMYFMACSSTGCREPSIKVTMWNDQN